MLALVKLAVGGPSKKSSSDTAHLLGDPNNLPVSPLPWLNDFSENLWGQEWVPCCNYTNSLNSVTLHKVTAINNMPQKQQLNVHLLKSSIICFKLQIHFLGSCCIFIQLMPKYPNELFFIGLCLFGFFSPRSAFQGPDHCFEEQEIWLWWQAMFWWDSLSDWVVLKQWWVLPLSLDSQCSRGQGGKER